LSSFHIDIHFLMLTLSHKLFILAVFLCLIGCLSSHKAQALTIDSVRFGVHPDKVRMVVELDQSADFKAFVLENPYRLVVDLPRYDWKAGQVSKPKGTAIRDIRTGTLNNTMSRLVIDMASPIAIQSAFLLAKAGANPDRLVIDFKSVSVNAFNDSKSNHYGALDNNMITDTQQANNIIIDAPERIVAPSTIITPTHKPAHSLASKPTPVAKSPIRKPLIVIDAGHGGPDPGSIGQNNVFEKKVTLAAALELKEQLEKTGRYRVHLTRNNDTFIKLHQRVNIARSKEADMFISLHADSIADSSVRGASIYTLSNKASDAQTAKLAARENRADLIAGIDLSHEDKEVSDILLDLAMRDTMNQSKFFANIVVDTLKNNNIPILGRTHRYAGFAVLKAPDIPSVLIEMGFMSNKKDVDLLSTPAYRRKMASALTQSIDQYFSKVEKNQNG